MANYNKKKGNSALSIIAVILALLLIASIVMGLGMHFGGWFSDEEDAEETEQVGEEVADNDGMSVTAVEMDGISISLKKVSSDEETGGEIVEEVSLLGATNVTSSTYTITATITPSNAADQMVDMYVEWSDEGDTFASGKTVTDYVTVTQESEGSLTGTLTCKQAFGSEIMLRVVSYDDSNVYAVASIDYLARVNSVSVTASSSTFTFGSPITVNVDYTYGYGTKYGTMSINSIYLSLSDAFQSKLITNLRTLGVDTDEYTLKANATISSSFVDGGSYTFSDYTAWFSYDDADSSDFYDSCYATAFKQTVNSLVNSGTTCGAICLSCTYKYDGNTISSHTPSYSVYFNVSNVITAVTGVSLSTDNIIF